MNLLLVRKLDSPHWTISGAGHPLVTVLSEGAWTIFIIGACLGNCRLGLAALESAAPAEVVSAFARLRQQTHGHYGLVAVNHDSGAAVASSDAYGICKLYLADLDSEAAIGTCLAQVAACAGTAQWHESAVSFFLMHGYTPSKHTFFEGIEKLPPGECMVLAGGRRVYSTWMQPDPEWLTEEAYYERVAQAWEASIDAVEDAGSRVVSALSGGIDSTFLLTSLLARQGLKARTVSRTGAIHLQPGRGAAINASDVDAARALASDLGVVHEVRRLDLFDSSLGDQLSRMVAELGADAHVGSMMFTRLCDSGANELMLAAQNADSVFSYTVVGSPALGKSLRKPIDGIGNLLLRYLYFGGYKRCRKLHERPMHAVLGALYRAKTGQSITRVTTRDCQLGMILKTRWPVPQESLRMQFDERCLRLEGWSREHYLGGIDDVAEPEQHALALFNLFRHTFMQGSDNRGTVWSCVAGGSRALLPFASDAILAASLRRIPGWRTWFRGKWPVFRMAKAQPSLPTRVYQRRADLPANIEFEIYRAILSNPGVRDRLDCHLERQREHIEQLGSLLGGREIDLMRQRWQRGDWQESMVHRDFRIFWLLESTQMALHGDWPPNSGHAAIDGEGRM